MGYFGAAPFSSLLLRSQSDFRRFAWTVLGYTVLVILWGGYVRASGSGAGCGDHWPLCNGELVPRDPTMQTVVEFGHRLTSGLAGILALVLLIWAWRAFPKGSAVRKGAAAAFFFMMTEAAIGAGLVLFEYVAYNPSIARAYWMAAHLTNTFFLLAALVLTAWWASGGGVPRWRGRGTIGVSIGAALLGLLVLGASGAITALGDTLAIGGGLDPAAEPIVATLTGLRIYHPLLACVVFVFVASIVFVAYRRREPWATLRFGVGVVVLMLVQLWIGLVNVWLHAPVEIQLVHLLVTDLIWIGLVLFTTESLAVRAQASRPETALSSA